MERFEEYFNRLDESSILKAQSELSKNIGDILSVMSNNANKNIKSDGNKNIEIKEPKNLLETKYFIIATLKKYGISDNMSIANILSQLVSESGMKLQTESTNWGANFLYNTWGPEQSKNKVRIKSKKHAEQVASLSPEEKAEMMYGGRNGNDEPGDGYKYRGRGFIQLSGKNNYRYYGKKIGVDLVSNPELANDIRYAADIIAVYFLGRSGNNVSKLQDIDEVNKMTGFATADENIRINNAEKFYVALEAEMQNFDYYIAKDEKKFISDTIEKFNPKDIGLIDPKAKISNTADIFGVALFADDSIENIKKKYNIDTSKYVDAKNKNSKETSKEKPKEQLKDFKDYKSLDDLANDIHKSRLSFYYS